MLFNLEKYKKLVCSINVSQTHLIIMRISEDTINLHKRKGNPVGRSMRGPGSQLHSELGTKNNKSHSANNDYNI